MNKIFAKVGSTERVLVFVPNGNTITIAEQLQQQYGGLWVVVEILKHNEILLLQDLHYNGFIKDYEGRYCTYIKTLDNEK